MRRRVVIYGEDHQERELTGYFMRTRLRHLVDPAATVEMIDFRLQTGYGVDLVIVIHEGHSDQVRRRTLNALRMLYGRWKRVPVLLLDMAHNLPRTARCTVRLNGVRLAGDILDAAEAAIERRAWPMTNAA